MISEHASPLAAVGGVDAGGQNIHVARLASALAQRGHAVDVYTRRDHHYLPSRATAPEGYRVVHVPAGPANPLPKDELLPYMGRFGEWLASRWMDTDPPDVVHAHFWMSGVAALTAARRQPRPLVVTFHALGSVKHRMQGTADTSPTSRLDLERRVGLGAHRVIAQSCDEIAELAAYGVGSERIGLVPSGVDIDVFRPDSETAENHSRQRILAVGRLVERKGFADVVKALPELPSAEFVVAGGPSEYPLTQDPVANRLLDLARGLGVSDRLRLLGAVPPEEMPAWYRSADVLACTPTYEPFGITPLEAMACGTPVVAYRVGGLQDTVVHGHTGTLVTPGDHEGLVNAIGALLADNAYRNRLGEAARARVAQHYPWPRIAERVEYVYTGAIAAFKSADGAENMAALV
jgi:glycosyltransferase involved in cell wall biosynthesis